MESSYQLPLTFHPVTPCMARLMTVTTGPRFILSSYLASTIPSHHASHEQNEEDHTGGRRVTVLPFALHSTLNTRNEEGCE